MVKPVIGGSGESGYPTWAFIGQKLVCSQITRGLVQSKSPSDLFAYNCTEAGIRAAVQRYDCSKQKSLIRRISNLNSS